MNNEKEYLLTYDNKHVITGERIKINISQSMLEFYAKCFFNWRTPTKKYKTISERVFALGSTEYDNLIEYIAKRKEIL